jgi:pyruvate/2-oxoacid:ferredoxin oxidoreductase beta subunit
VFPLFEVFRGKEYRLTPMGEKVPVTEYLTLQGRYRGLSEEGSDVIQQKVDRDWAELEKMAAGRGGRADDRN